MRFEGAVLTSVVPQITGALAECARHYTGRKPVIVSPEIRTGLTMGWMNPTPWARIALWMRPTRRQIFRCRSSRWTLAPPPPLMWWTRTACSGGGVICPGLSTGLRALGDRCAQLPQVHLGSPKSAIGTNTEKCMLSGSVMGTAVLIDGMVQRIEEELGPPGHSGGHRRAGKVRHTAVPPPLTYDPELLMKGLALCTS